MRFRLLPVAVAAIGLVVMGPPGVAAAQTVEEEVEEIVGEDLTEEQVEEIQGGLSEEEFHCLVEQLHQLEGGEPVSTCEEAPNPILPATNEIVWAVISFAVLFALLAKFAFPAIRRGLEGREQSIRDDLEAAERSRQEAEQTLAEYRQQLADARSDAGRIIEEARQAADSMRREVQESAEAEAAAIRERAQAEIDQSVARARSDLQRQMGDFAVNLAERIVQRNLDPQAQSALIDQYIEEVAGMSPNGGSTS